MKELQPTRLLMVIAALCAMLSFMLISTPVAFGQDVPIATATSTEPVVSTSTFTPTPTSTSTTSEPVPIPEPVTVVLFGTGLAALTAAVATRRNQKQDDE